MTLIDYRSLPAATGGYSELFLDAIDAFPRVQPFLRHDFRDTAAFERIARAQVQRGIDRGLLAEVLRAQNSAFGASTRTFENIALLARPTTVAVVTGQQVGLFGGPMYTIFKTITAIKLAARLKGEIPGFDFVPVFWLEGEDHDFAEVNHTSVLDSDNRVVRCEYLPGGALPERNPGPVGEIHFDAHLATTFAQLEQSLAQTEFKEQLLAMLRGCYREGRTFNHAFAAWMNMLFEDHGLVFVSANQPEFKRLLSPIFVRELQEFPATSQTVISQSAELEARYHAQIKPRSVNLFMFHKGGRFLIEPRESDFSLKGTRHFISRDDMVRIAQESPELLSPNVVLRPLAQDTLLPTVAYVAGPAELAYHAQLSPVYDRFGVVQPVIYPRASGTFLEDRLKRAMEKYDLELMEFFEDHARLITRVVDQISEINVEALFSEASSRMQDVLNELRFGIREIDPTLLAVLENVRSKGDINLAVLREKAQAAQKKRNEVAVRQIERAVNGLLPDGNLQERSLNILHFMNKYGPDLIRWLTAELDISAFQHQILTL